MNENLEKQMLKSIEITKDSIKNSMQVSIESYAEVLSRLDLLSYFLVNKNLR